MAFTVGFHDQKDRKPTVYYIDTEKRSIYMKDVLYRYHNNYWEGSVNAYTIKGQYIYVAKVENDFLVIETYDIVQNKSISKITSPKSIYNLLQEHGVDITPDKKRFFFTSAFDLDENGIAHIIFTSAFDLYENGIAHIIVESDKTCTFIWDTKNVSSLKTVVVNLPEISMKGLFKNYNDFGQLDEGWRLAGWHNNQLFASHKISLEESRLIDSCVYLIKCFNADETLNRSFTINAGGSKHLIYKTSYSEALGTNMTNTASSIYFDKDSGYIYTVSVIKDLSNSKSDFAFLLKKFDQKWQSTVE
jgi:hypothetical protein